MDSLFAYRLIILLDDAEKILERILADRIVQYLDTVGPNLSENQLGFTREQSTMDAITILRRLTGTAAERADWVFVVSLDIASAFNTLP